MGRENLEPKSHHRLCLWWPATVGLCEDAEPSLFEVPLRKPWCACVHAHFYAYRQETRHTTKIKCIIPLEIQNSMALSRSYKYIEAKKRENNTVKEYVKSHAAHDVPFTHNIWCFEVPTAFPVLWQMFAI